MVICPECGESKERVSQHWAMSGCGYPDLSDRQLSVIRGMMLAGGTIAGNGKNRFVTIGTTSELLAKWTVHQLDWLAQGIREVDGTGDGDDVYRIRTVAHPSCNRFERWEKLAENSGRSPPNRFSLDQATASVWWAFAGGLQWADPWQSSCQGTFSAQRDEKAAWIQRVLEDTGFDTNRAGKRVQFPPLETGRWLEWLGNPIPGADHKWEPSPIDYRVQRQAPESESDRRAERCLAALEIAAKRTDMDLSPDVFENRVEAADADEVAETLGGGSWEDALSIADVQTEAVGSNSRGQSTTIDIEEAADLISRAVAAVGEPLTIEAYQDWRADQDGAAVSGNSIAKKFGWKNVCDAAGVEHGAPWRNLPPDPMVDGKQDAVELLEKAASAVGEPLTTKKYQNWAQRHDDAPATPAPILRYFEGGWADACRAAGVEPGVARGGPSKRISQRECEQSLRAAAMDIEGEVSYTKYREWRAGQDRDRPSGATISQRFADGWDAAKESAGIE